MAKILITGGSGSIGRKLIPKLKAAGNEVSIIGRTQTNGLGVSSFVWDLEKGTMDENALRDVTHIIHLAGAGIADKPWSSKRKNEIIESRVQPLQLITKLLENRNQRIDAIISSSAVGYYGATTSETVFSETDSAASDFLGATCKTWEDAVQFVKPFADREVRIRTGIVLMKEGGALPKLAKPVKYGFGAAVGSGNQWMPWIHVDDLSDIYLRAVDDGNMNGAYNAVAPEHVNQSDFIKKIGSSMNRPVFLPPVPGFMLKTVLGEMAMVVTEGSRVSSQKLMDDGFEFNYPQLQPALNQLLR